MLVIIEGPDGSGKTSLANRLRKDLSSPCLFLRSNGAPTRVEDLAQIIHWINALPLYVPLITDRNPLISEYVYGPILRGKCMHKWTLEQMANWSKRALVIYCRPSWSALAQALRREIQLEGVIENHRIIVEAYDKLMSEFQTRGVEVVPYDFTGPPQLIMDRVRSYIRSNSNGFDES